MKGKYNILIGNNKVTYDFVLERQITILKGKSGSGKTTLFEMFENIVRKGKNHSLGYKCNCTDKLRIIDSDCDLSSIKTEHNKIFVADEYCDLVQTKEFAEAVSNSDNYFIFITRSGRMKWLTYSVKDIYELRTTKDESGKFVTRLYSRYLDTKY